MAEETKVIDTNTKTQLSLAAALFFSPLVQNMLKQNTWDITEKDKNFIRWYIKFGYITLLFWVITIVTGVMNYLFVLNILSVTYTVSIFILIFLLLISIVSILSDISLLKWGDHAVETYTIEGSKKDVILKYLPIYNIYLWYKAHSFDTPNRRIKESILLRALFMILSMAWNVMIDSIVLILVILRIAALMSDIDFINVPTKQRLNRLFFKNPEEIFGYVTGTFAYLGKSFARIFTKKPPYSIEEEIKKEKENYGHILDIQGNTGIILEYILWMILIGWLVYIAKLDFTVWTYYAGFWLLVARYLVMAIQLKHLPHFPIAREIILLLKGIWSLFKKKSFTNNQ
ncbi:MAG: hypothetical protein ACD_80C00080G0004 [uncultured bacterium (gcode 4)]|uniref:Uncharacterized protein n=1 Tax=uncultured bacterium (gcode 4) TaxID=1234023 RepID=K1XJH8_9BACT|nr:MAG: hypothetical protein ACD_80C00080G0004 [uncultured bacterium (gcode 4)]